MIESVMAGWDLESLDLLFIENVGNLVCPAGWDLGVTAKIVVFSVTEGEDKPLKYPRMFERAAVAVLNKMDLLPHLRFDLDLAVANARAVNPDLEFCFTSALTGEGMEAWYDLLRCQVRPKASRVW
jgi:hydrogenase nickel incorporation protein HypB